MRNIFSILMLAFISMAFVSDNSAYVIDQEFTLKIKGTSNVHDWESNVMELSGMLDLNITDDSYLEINTCNVEIPVGAIKSSKGNIMDKKTRKALNDKEYPVITYTLTDFQRVNISQSNFTSNTTGNLTVSGVTKSIDMKVSGTYNSNGNIQLSGTKDLKMTDFGIDPPTALLGTMKTGDDITIEFSINITEKSKS